MSLTKDFGRHVRTAQQANLSARDAIAYGLRKVNADQLFSTQTQAQENSVMGRPANAGPFGSVPPPPPPPAPPPVGLSAQLHDLVTSTTPLFNE